MWVKQAEAARVEGVSRQWVHALVKAKRLPPNEKGEVNLIELRRLRAEGLDPARGAHKQTVRAAPEGVGVEAPARGGLTYLQARTAREAYMAKIAELDLGERRGDLVLRVDEERAMRTLASAIVMQLDAIPDRIAAEFGATDETRVKIRQRVREEIDRIRAEFSRADVLEVKQ